MLTFASHMLTSYVNVCILFWMKNTFRLQICPDEYFYLGNCVLHMILHLQSQKFMLISLSCNGGGNLSHVSSYGVIFPITAQTDTKPSRSTTEMKKTQNAWILCYNMKRFTGIKDPTFSTAASLISGPWSKLTRINSSQKLNRLSSQIILNCQPFWKSQPHSHIQKYRR